MEFDDIDVKSLSQYARYIVSHYERIVVFVAKIYDSAQVVIAVSSTLEEKADDLYRRIAPVLHLHGGGNEVLAQGGGAWHKNLFEQIKILLTAE